MTSTVHSPQLTSNGFDPNASGGGKPPKKRLTTVLKFFGGVAAVVTAAAAVWAILEGNRLQDDNNALQRAAQNSHLEEQMMGLDAHFVRYPQLRPFFYKTFDGRQADPLRPRRLRAQALSTAEMVIDFADDIGAYIRVSKMDDQDSARWVAMMRSYFDESPIVRLQWKHFNSASEGSGGSYDRFTACVLGAPQGEALKHWNWRTGKPRASRSGPCNAETLG